MSGSMTVDSISIAVQARIPVLLWGGPGTGKTSFLMQLAAALGLPIEVVLASLRDPTEFGGMPVVQSDGSIRLAPPNWARAMVRYGRGVVFFDEISTTTPATQKALLRVTQDRWVGDEKLPDEVAFVAAANPVESAADGWDLAAPLANRWMHLQWTIQPLAWVEGFIGGWAGTSPIRLPAGWESGISHQRVLVGAFIRARPSLLFDMPKETSAAGHAWPSPRTWDMAARALAACVASGASPEVESEMVCGLVGDAAGGQFLVWRRELDLPSPEELLSGKRQLPDASRTDRLYAALCALAQAVVEKSTKSRWAAAWRVLGTLPESARDVGIIAARILGKCRPAGAPVPAEARIFLPLVNMIEQASRGEE